jgi:hypothetical protein
VRLAVALVVLGLSGCASAAPATAAVDIGRVAACIIGQLQSSADVQQIAAACGPATAADVLEIVTELLAAEAPSDAGAPSPALLHAKQIKASHP